MTTYEITSATGHTMGTYEGSTPAEALAAMHRDAGYRVIVEDDDVIFASEGDAEVCGGLDVWTVREVAVAPAVAPAVALHNDPKRPTLVDDMTDAEVALCIHNASAIDTDILVREDGAYDTDREYVAAYASAMLERYGEVWTLP